MLCCFFRKRKSEKVIENAKSYIGLAAPGYGENYDLIPFVFKKLDDHFKDDFYFNLAIGNRRFDNFEQAIKYTSRRGVSEFSAYVIGLKCPIDQIDGFRKKGELSDQTVSITNAVTKEPLREDSPLLKPKNNHENSDKPHSSSIRVE
jgi:hypothetical protein